MQSIIGWTALILFGCIFLAQIYIYCAVKRLLVNIAKNCNDEEMVVAAKEACKKNARARVKWVRANKPRFHGDFLSKANKIVWIDMLSFIVFGALVVLWLMAILLNS